MTETVIAEMGSPRWFAELAQGPGGAAMLSTFLDAARTVEWERPGHGHNAGALVRREAVGVVGAITPWNVPQLVIMPKLAPALLAGCTIVVKAAPESPLDALLLAEIIDEAGLPEGVVSILVGGREAGEHLVRHPDVDKIAFTGSSAVGRRIAGICGERLARCSLELGGKSAAVVLPDADLGRTAEGLKFASFLNNGQACVAQTRVLAPRSLRGGRGCPGRHGRGPHRRRPERSVDLRGAPGGAAPARTGARVSAPGGERGCPNRGRRHRAATRRRRRTRLVRGAHVAG